MKQSAVSMFLGKKRNRTLIFFAVLALMFLIIWLVQPIKINKTVEGLKVDIANESLIEPITLIFTGKYYSNPFGKDHFSGFLKISGYNFSTETHVLCDFYVTKDKGGAVLAYRDTRADSTYPEPFVLFGEIHSSEYFEDIVLFVYTKNHYPATGLDFSLDKAVSIVTNVTSREEAVQKALTFLRLTGD